MYSEEYYRPLPHCAECNARADILEKNGDGLRLYQYRKPNMSWWTVDQLCFKCAEKFKQDNIAIREV